MSSSGKSINASTCATTPIKFSLSASLWSPSLPCICSCAARIARSVWAEMRSMIASAWVRSILPFSKARRLNSPGSAERAPHSNSRSRTRLVTSTPPWQASSTTSSPVKLLGFLNTVAKTSSITRPSAFTTLHSVAYRSSAFSSPPLQRTAAAEIFTASMPETRISETAPTPGAEAMATTVVFIKMLLELTSSRSDIAHSQPWFRWKSSPNQEAYSRAWL